MTRPDAYPNRASGRLVAGVDWDAEPRIRPLVHSAAIVAATGLAAPARVEQRSTIPAVPVPMFGRVSPTSSSPNVIGCRVAWCKSRIRDGLRSLLEEAATDHWLPTVTTLSGVTALDIRSYRG